MKRVILAFAVMCVLSVPTWAGDVPTVDYTPPPPPPQTIAVPGEVPSGEAESTSDAWQLLLITVLTLIS